MTMLGAPPADAAQGERIVAAGRREAATRIARPRPPFVSDFLATAALATFSIVVAAGFARVFNGWAFFDNLVLLALVGHGIGLVGRRLRLPFWVSIPVMAVAVCWTIGVLFYGETYSWGLPSGDTLSLFMSELDLVRDQFDVAVAPVIDAGGWDVLAAIGMACAVVLADAFAFGAQARAEALVPGGVLFVFVAALGSDRLRVPLSVALVGAGVVATAVLRVHHSAGGIDARRGRSPARVVTVAIALAALVAWGAGTVGQRLPGAAAEPLFDTRGAGGGGGTELEPLVDIRSRLTNQSTAELFVVQANVESYWRSTALPQFDGRTWGLPNRTVGIIAVDARADDVEIRQSIRVVELTGSVVPAAPNPIAASPPGTLQFDAGTSTLVTASGELDRADSFEVVSSSPRLDPAVLEQATATDSGDPIHLELPDDFPESVDELARQVTAGTNSPYAAAMALQNWFHAEFAYSLEVQPGHGNNAIEGFVRDRVGYCEQFAGTFAAMMRSLGFPARVSVGYTSGRPLGGNSFSVAGKYSHAWPEVWFDDIGWVLFEPTPGRGAPGAESYTGLAPSQDTSTDTETNAGSGAAVPTTVAPVTPNPAIDPSLLDGPDGGPAETADPTDTVDTAESGRPWIQLTVIVALLVAVVLPAAVRRVRRRAPGRTHAEQVINLWDRSLESLRDVGVGVTASDTPQEAATTTMHQFPIAARPIRSLAEVVTIAVYHPDGTAGFTTMGAYGSSVLRDSAHWTRQIERAVNDSMSTGDRVRRYFTRWH